MDIFRNAPKAILLLALVWLFAAPVRAASIEALHGVRFETVGDDELASAEVTCILQDRNGFLWFGTYAKGLFRYDGYEFRRYRSDPRDPASLGSDTIWTLAEAADGAIWVGTWGAGLNRFDPVSETFRRFPHHEGDHGSIADDRISALLVDTRGALWIGTYGGGLALIALPTQARIEIRSLRYDPKDPAGPGSDRIWSLAESDGRLWVGHRFAGLDSLRLDGAVPGDKPHFEHYRAGPGPGSLSSDAVWSMAKSADGSLWVASADGGGLNHFDVRTGRSTVLNKAKGDLPFESVRTVFEDSSGAVWIASHGFGVIRYEPKSGAKVVYGHHEGEAGSISSDHVVAAFEDRQGLVWFGTWGGGVSRFDARRARFGLHSHHPDDPSSVGPGIVKGILEDRRGRLWIGTDKGLNVRNSPAGAIPRFERLGDPFRDQYISSLFEDRDGTIWVGANSTIAAVPDASKRATPLLSNLARLRRELGAPRVMVIRQDRDGALWFGTWSSGLCRWDGQRLQKYVSIIPSRENLPSEMVALLIDSRGRFWVGTRGEGLLQFDPRSGRFHRRGDPREEAANYASRRIIDIVEARDGKLWIATFGAGIREYDPTTGAVRRFGEREGLSSNYVMRILPDEKGRVWLATGKGIDRFDPRTREVVAFDARDGLQSGSFSSETDGASFLGRDGTLYFGGERGFNAFHPRDITDTFDVPRVTVTRFLLRNQPVPVAKDGILTRNIVLTDALELEHTDTLVGFEFSALDYRRPDRVRYAYTLEGFDSQWIETGPRDRKAVYTTLPPGRFVFRVRAWSGGRWFETSRGIRLLVRPPWWRRWWALMLFAMTAVALFVAAVRYRTYQHKRKTEELAALVRERTAELAESETRAVEASAHAQEATRAKSVFLANMSHELRTPLNAILGFAQLLDRRTSLDDESRANVKTILRSGDHLLQLIDDVLSLSKIEAGRLTIVHQPFDPLKMLETVRSLIGVRAEDKGLEVVFDVDRSFPSFASGDEQKLRQVILNLLGNAVKFTERGTVRLMARWLDGRARIEVHDTGPGIDRAEMDGLFEAFVQTSSGTQSREGTGLGLAISRQIVREMGGDIQVRSNPGSGSTFHFEIDLPEVTGAREMREAARVVAVDPRPGERVPRVLVVDDGAANRAVLTNLLQSVGFQVSEASNGAEAIQRWREQRPHVVIMDMRMPVMDGREAMKRIREEEERERLPRSPILALTASALEHERDDILACGADGFLSKPFREALIFQKLAELTGCSYRVAATEETNLEESVDSGRMAQLSEHHRRELWNALNRGDVEESLRVSSQIGAEDAPLGRAIENYIREYRFDELQALIDEAADVA